MYAASAEGGAVFLYNPYRVGWYVLRKAYVWLSGSPGHARHLRLLAPGATFLYFREVLLYDP